MDDYSILCVAVSFVNQSHEVESRCRASYNTKLISSCLKQTLTLTLTLGPVTPTKAITPEEADGAEEALAAEAAAVAETIAERQLLNIYLKEK